MDLNVTSIGSWSNPFDNQKILVEPITSLSILIVQSISDHYFDEVYSGKLIVIDVSDMA